MIKWDPVYEGKHKYVYVTIELIAINILTTGLIPKISNREQAMF